MKNSILLCVVTATLFLTGCSASYDMELGDFYMTNETLTISNFDDICPIENFDECISEIFHTVINLKFDKEVKSDSSYDLIIARDKTKLKNLNSDYELLQYFGNLSFDKKHKTISFYPNYGKCETIFRNNKNSKLTINLTFPFLVKDHNAKYVSEDVYTWEYNLDNCDEGISIKYIPLSLRRIVVYSGLAVFGILTTILVVKKVKKINEI